jgi:hypothetical protein
VLRELLTFQWSSDRPRFNDLMTAGGCYPALPSVEFARLEHGEDFSLFRMITAPLDRYGEAPALWFRNEAMVIEGSNADASPD